MVWGTRTSVHDGRAEDCTGPSMRTASVSLDAWCNEWRSTMPHNEAFGTVRTSYIIDYWTTCRALRPWTGLSFKRNLGETISIQHILGLSCHTADDSQSGFSWHDAMVLPGVRRAAVHMEDLAQLCHTCAARRYHPDCHTIR